jgi:hypothetical protein
MKDLKSIIELTLVLFASFAFTACSDEDKDIHFTKNEVVQGDILTGKQVSIPGNTINVYTTMSDVVNVQNASGVISAVSKNENIATVRVVNASYDGEPIQDKGIEIRGIQVGETNIVVSDADGKTATLNVKVEDVSLFWNTICTYKKTSLVEDEVEIEGIDETSTGVIKTDILSNKAKENTFIIKASKSYPFSVYKMQVLDKNENVLYELVSGTVSGSGYKFHLPSQDQTSGVKTYSFYEETNSFGKWLVEDISDDYKAQYPKVKVLLKMKIETED